MAQSRKRDGRWKASGPHVQLHSAYRRFVLAKRRMGYTTKMLAALGGFIDQGTWTNQLYDAFAPSDLNLGRWRRLADALEYTDTIIVDAEPVPYLPALMEAR